MKKTCRIARYVLSLLIIACFSGTAFAAPYGSKGREINWIQPGGEKLTLRVFGDEFYARTETTDGYTVVYNAKDGAYHYAELGANGKSLKPSGVVAHRQPLKGMAKHLDLPVDQIRIARLKILERFDTHRAERWQKRVQAFQQVQSARRSGVQLRGPQAAFARINAAPVIGNKIGLTILVQFPNDPRTTGADPVDFPSSRTKIVRFCNNDGYADDGNTGSVRDYFFDQSLGKVTYTQVVTTVVTLPNPRNYYNFSDYPTNNILRDPGSAGEEIILNAVSILKASNFNFTSLTVDDDSNAVATNIFYAGADSGVWAQGLWPHSSTITTPLSVGTTAKPVFLNAYQITNIENDSPVIGTFIHENGHLLMGYPDLYSYVGQGEGVGDHCVMGGGSYNNDGKTPAPISAYLKDVSGWANVTDLTTDDYIGKTLPTSGNIAYRIFKPGSSTESFYVENRGTGDRWAQYAVDKGIIIWHIDGAIDGNGNRFGIDPHYGVSVEQADGAGDLEFGSNRGDSTDLFDLATPLFSDTTTPNANWWDGSDSSIRVKVVSGVGDKTNVQFGKLPINTIILESPNGGEIMYRDSTFVIKWEANIVGNVKIDLYKSGVFLKNIANNAPNTGNYKWEIPESQDAGKNYTVRITSISNSPEVFDVSDATFTITDSTFPAGNAMPYGWFTPADAAAGWKVTQSSVYEGSHSLTSKPVGDGRTAAVAYTSNFKAGTVSFYMKVSSEVGYDYASFLIDGVRQFMPAASSKKGLTGRRNWAFASFPLSAGEHTLTWTYEKDDSYGEGKDTAWLDGVLLPKTTQEIAVNDNKGDALISANGQTTFPASRMGKKSEPVTFTIENKGQADLHGLKLALKGSNPGAFILGSLGKTILKPGQSTKFNVTFAPSDPGLKKAEIRIQSNDDNENPFVISLGALALGIPEIEVFQPEDNKLKDGKDVVNFGSKTVGQTGNAKTFTVKNVGSAVLKDLKVSKSGANKGDFEVRAIGSTSLAPGDSTTFKVTFTPGQSNERTAKLGITYNYDKAGSFDIDLKGTGATKNAAKSAIAGSDSSGLFDAVFGSAEVDAAIGHAPVLSSAVMDGRKYLSLIIAKPLLPDGAKRTVEVSSNLVDWFSGPKHTSIVTDNAAFQKVRDNTPVTPGVKRYIRLKTTRP